MGMLACQVFGLTPAASEWMASCPSRGKDGCIHVEPEIVVSIRLIVPTDLHKFCKIFFFVVFSQRRAYSELN